MTIKRDKIVKYVSEYLKADTFKDYCLNGLQVEGADDIKKIVVGVSISEKLIKAAIKEKAQMIMVHHGFFSGNIGDPPQITGFMRDRIKLLLENDINLCGYHLPLDAHPQIGNNISLLKMLGLKRVDVISSPSYGDIGYVGEYARAVDFSEFTKKVKQKINKKIFMIDGKKKVKRVGIVSGGASPDFLTAAQLGADTYLCGDARESVVRAVEEVGINFVNAGHYNTETSGIQNLGNLIEKKFNIPVKYIDIPCEV